MASSKLNWTGRGQEPFWSLRIDGLETEFRQPGAGYSRTAERVERHEAPDGQNVAKFFSSGAPYLSVSRMDGLCVDASSGAPHPYKLQVQSGEQRLVGCGGTSTEFLSHKDWVIEDVNRRGVVDRGEPRVEFGPEGRIILNSICRQISGEFKTEGPQITIRMEAVGDHGCSIAALARQEEAILAAFSVPLQMSANTENELFLDAGKEGRLHLRR